MNYHLDNNSYSRYGNKRTAARFRWKLIILALVILMVFGQWLFGFLDGIGGVLLGPIWKSWNGLSTEVVERASPRTKAALIAENQQLLRKLDHLERELATKELLERENQELQSLVHRFPPEAKPVIGRVVARPDQSPYDILVIDVGTESSDQTLEIGDRVMVDGILLGHIVDVGQTMSKVRLLSSPGVSTPVLLLATSTIATQAAGLGAGNFQIKLPRGVDVTLDDPIVYASSTSMLIGKAGLIDNRPDEPFQIIRFRSPVNFFTLEWVEIYGS